MVSEYTFTNKQMTLSASLDFWASTIHQKYTEYQKKYVLNLSPKI